MASRIPAGRRSGGRQRVVRKSLKRAGSEQDRAVHPSPRRHSPRGRESAGGRIINPGAGQTLSLRSVAAGNQYSAVGQQRRGVLGTHFGHRAGRVKRSRRLRRAMPAQKDIQSGKELTLILDPLTAPQYSLASWKSRLRSPGCSRFLWTCLEARGSSPDIRLRSRDSRLRRLPPRLFHLQSPVPEN